MWTIYEGDRDYFYGDAYDGTYSYDGAHGYDHHSHGYTHHSHSLGHPSIEHSHYGHPYASSYSVDVPSLSPMVEIRVHISSERSRKAIMKKLGKLKGVVSVEVDIHNQKVTVTGNVTPAEVLKKLRRSGRKAELWMGDVHSSPLGYRPGFPSAGYSSSPSVGAVVYTN